MLKLTTLFRGSIQRLAVALILCVSSGSIVYAAEGPQLICGGGDPTPHVAPLGQPANIGVWRAADVSQPWRPPACTQWAPRNFTALLTVTGQLRGGDAAATLLARFAAISESRNIRYWSYSRKTWRPLFTEITALVGPDDHLRRRDFEPSELETGKNLYFLSKENPLMTGAIYQMRFLEILPDRIVVSQKNINTVKYLFATLLEPGDFESVVVLSRDAGAIWNYVQLIRFGDGKRSLSQQQRASLLNRAVAAFRHLGRQQTDKNPPAAP